MLNRIRAYLEKNPGTKAKSIATLLGVDRAEVNRVLHEHKDLFVQDSDFQWQVLSSICRVEFGGSKWLTAYDFENALSAASPFARLDTTVVLALGDDHRPLLEFLARLLALSNQLVAAGRSVTLDLDGSPTTLTYLDRVGFFGVLAPGVAVRPQRPAGELAKVFHGNNAGVIEFRFIDPSAPDQEIPRLLRRSFVSRAGNAYSQAALTVLGELFTNVLEHSGTDSSAFACLQFYPKTSKIQVVISDNGKGIVGTLEPVLSSRFPQIAKKIAAAKHPGVALLTEVFSRGGLSQVAEEGRGVGLMASAAVATKFKAKVSVRQKDFELYVRRDHDSLQFSHRLDRAPLAGTHICFEFKLDASVKSA